MNRRLLTFLIVFILVCASGLAYVYSIPPTYVSVATLKVDSGASPGEQAASFVADEAQALNSNEMLEAVLKRLRDQPALSTFATLHALRETLIATPMSGTSVIELKAHGRERAQLPELLNAWATVYLESRRNRRTQDRDANVEEARSTVDSIESRVARKRRELEDYRRQHDIVSSERGENEVAAQMKSLMSALNDARSKAVDAESRMTAIKASMAEGTPVYRTEDKALIAQLEQRVLDLRQKLKELELRFTPQYLALEPNVKTMYANIRQVEQQIEDTRRSSQQAALNEAAQNLATAQKNVARLEAQFGERRRDAMRFTSRFAEHKAHSDELARLEAQLGQAKQRLASLEGSDRTREPRYELLGSATAPDKPAHPDYTRFTAYTVGGGLLAALLAVMLVEFLSPRPAPQTPLPAPIIQIAYPAWPAQALGRPEDRLALPMTPEPLPAAQLTGPLRELATSEVAALWNSATREGRLAVAALFTGLTLEELATLQWSDVDMSEGRLKLRQTHRLHLIRAPFTQELEARSSMRDRGGAVASTAASAALTSADLAGLIAAAAHDAGIDHAENIDAHTLRHTYIGYLVRQGLRLSELEDIVGPVTPASFLHLRTLSPPGPGRHAAEINAVFPAFLDT
jgi:polysaccharide biosynthesis transport protein